MTVVQGRYFGMDLRGDLVFRVDDRLDIELHAVFMPVDGYIAIAIRDRNRNASADQDVCGLPGHGRDGRAGEDARLAFIDERLQGHIHIRDVRAQPAAVFSGGGEIFAAVEETCGAYGDVVIGIIRAAARVAARPRGLRPVLDAEVLGIVRIDFYDLRLEADLARMLHFKKVNHAGFIAARVETGDFHRDVVLILVLDLAAEHHAVLHHLHMDFRIADGVLDGARHAAVIARDIHGVLGAPSAVRPDDERGRPCLLPNEEEIS